MSDLRLRIESMLTLIDAYEGDGFDKIDELESIIMECNKLANSPDADPIADSIYDVMYDLLRKEKPSSVVLSSIWEDSNEELTGYTELLKKHPMYSIETAKSYDCKELMDFIGRMPEEAGYFASYKINGHGIRVVYDDGVLVSASSRARSSRGRDLTRHMRVLLGEVNPLLEGYGVVELRGEIALPFCNLEKAREYNPSIKSAFSGVSSMIKPSASDEEIRLLDFLCYGFYTDGFSFIDREEEFQKIEELGYRTPDYLLVESCNSYDLLDTMRAIINEFEEGYEEFGYFCDGVVFEVNSRELFEEYGIEGNHKLGNIALKVGVWEQVQYCGYVQKILWSRGKSKLNPVAIVGDEPDMLLEDSDGNMMNHEQLGVLTAQGNKVRRVPLYEPKNILILDAYVGELLWFRYGSESGVVPCFSDGRLLKEDAAKDMLTGDYVFDDNNNTEGFAIG